jgi:RNA polymerase sigma-70 factor (ECF subfamily)
MEQAFLQMVKENQGIIHRVCRTYADGAEEREDLFQEVLLQLWKAYPNFRSEAKLSTWMYRVSLNVAISGLRKKKRRPALSSLDVAESLSSHEPTDQQESIAFLQKAIRTLPEVDRAIILLYLEDCSYDEISEVMGITPNHVGVKINRIKARLKKTLTPHLQ